MTIIHPNSGEIDLTAAAEPKANADDAILRRNRRRRGVPPRRSRHPRGLSPAAGIRQASPRPPASC